MRPLLALLVLSQFVDIARAESILKREHGCNTKCATVGCYVEAGRCLLDAARHREAKRLLKRAVAGYPDRTELHLLLAKTYLKLENKIWAQRTLFRATRIKPQDCQARSWLIWLHLKHAELEQAEMLLAENGCPTTAPMKARWNLLKAILQRYRKNPRVVVRELNQALESESLYVEDHRLLAQLSVGVLPLRPVPIRVRLEVGAGYTSNSLMSTPAQVASLGDSATTGSSALTLNLSAHFEPPWGKLVRPVSELGLRGLVLLGGAPVTPHSQLAPKDFSYFNVLFRPGLAIRTLRLLYGTQLFVLAGGDKFGEGPRVFYETHRGEFEWEPLCWLTLWGGVGRSMFREDIRTRTEVDAGMGLMGSLRRLRLIGGLSLRRHWAGQHYLKSFKTRVSAYSLWGGSLIGSATLPLRAVTLRSRIVLSFDVYPDSENYFKDLENAPVAANRRDILVKGGVEAWSPAWHGVRAGLGYDVSKRWSKVNTYEYMDHRVLLRLRWDLRLDPWKPATAKTTNDHVALPIATTRSRNLDDERIQDLLRQEDAARRGSSCLN